MRRKVVGVMGGGDVDAEVQTLAEGIGAAVARAGHVLLTGGRDAGVMAAASRGAHAVGGLVVGVLPGRDDSGANPDLDVAIVTGLGDGRNLVNVLSSDAVVVLPGGAGTLSEMALACKNSKPTLAVARDIPPELMEHVQQARTPEEVNTWLGRSLGEP